MGNPWRANRWTAILVAAGIAIVVLSVVPAWLVHERVVMGEGSRTVVVAWNAWRRDAFPVVTIGVVVVLGVTLFALARETRRPLLPAWPLAAGSIVAPALLLASAWPLERDISASHVSLSAGPALVAGIGLSLALMVASLRSARLQRPILLAILPLALVTLGAGVGARTLSLAAREAAADDRDGSYTRSATDGQPTATLTMTDGRYTVGDRWSGRFIRSGLTITFLEDPVCPEVRGTYHMLPADAERSGDRVRLDEVLDLCADGDRARDLEAGVWIRNP